jgi:phosphoserine phosphatase
MTSILTLAAARGGLTDDAVAGARAACAALSVATGAADWLAPATACDLPLDRPIDLAIVRAALDGHPVDLALTDPATRRKRLLIADMDSTIVTTESLDELARVAGLYDEIAAITARAMNGELDFAGALRARVGMLAGLETAALDRVAAEAETNPGAPTLIATMRRHGAYCALVSGGFKPVTERVRRDLGFDEDRANRLESDQGRFTGRVVEPILDKTAKLDALNELAAKLGTGPDDAVAVGDGANDLPMLMAAGLGVAWRAKPTVAAAARVRVDHADMRALLWFQGYRESDLVERG